MASFLAVAVMAFALPNAEGQPTVERAERRLGATQIHGGQSEDGGGAIRGRLRAAA